MGLGKVGGGPLRGVVGVGVIEAGDAEAVAAGIALDPDQLERRDLVAVVGGVGAGVGGCDGDRNLPAVRCSDTEQSASALVRVGLLGVGADLVVGRLRDGENGRRAVALGEGRSELGVGGGHL